ncbi:hypothetical protein TSUD_347990 [Trifolium subterraneum]|nr:hypothetical protein TSUD_347990 [Trifolium subterraneum]
MGRNSIDMDKERLTAEMNFKDSSSAVIKIRQRLPDFLKTVKLKYVKLGYGYSCNATTILIFTLVVPLLLFLAVQFQLTDLKLDRLSQLLLEHTVQLDTDTAIGSIVLLFLFGLYYAKRSPPIYMVDFACYKPENERKIARANNRKKITKKKEHQRGRESSSTVSRMEQTSVDYTNVRPLCINDHWGPKLDELENRLRDLSDTI